MDCHLWMRGDWNTSPHTSLSGVQSLPLFCSPLHVMLHPSFRALFRASPSSVLISPFLTDMQKKVWAVTEGLWVKCPQLSACLKCFKDQTYKIPEWIFSTKNNLTGFLYFIKKNEGDRGCLCWWHCLCHNKGICNRVFRLSGLVTVGWSAPLYPLQIGVHYIKIGVMKGFFFHSSNTLFLIF